MVYRLYILLITLMVISCGGGSGDNTKTNQVPSAFSFTAVVTGSLNTPMISNVVTVSGINTVVPISVTGGEYSINGGAFTNAAGSISNGQTVVVKTISAASIGSKTQAVLTISGVSQAFVVTTELPDITPDTFSFNAVTDAATNAHVVSAPITISGINTAVPISVANGEYSIDGGEFKSEAGIISKGQVVVLRLLSATTINTEQQVAVTIGGLTASFSVTTTSLLGGAVQGQPLNMAGVVTTLAGKPPSADGLGTLARFYSPSSVVSDGTYIYVADKLNHKIRKIHITTGTVTTLAGSTSFGSDDGLGSSARFKTPIGMVIVGSHLYVADRGNHKIRKIEKHTGVVTTVAGSGSQGRNDGVGIAASFGYPEDITTDGVNLYVADTNNSNIRKIVIATGMVTTLAGTGTYGYLDGIGIAASFGYPRGITCDGTFLFVSDTLNNKIRKIEIASGVVTTLAGSGVTGFQDGVGSLARFKSPRGITIAGSHLFVADTSNHAIRKIVIATGEVITISGGDSVGLDVDGSRLTARFSAPDDVAVDGGYLYIADAGNHKIRKIEMATGVTTTFAGGSSAGRVDGLGSAAAFYSPGGITTDSTYLYVVDTNNHQIRKVEIATGAVSTLAGNGMKGDANGIGAAARFNQPSGITIAGEYLYVTDTVNQTIRKIEIATGAVTKFAGLTLGTITSGVSGDSDGIGAAAAFDKPLGITNDGVYLYVTETGGKRIRKIEIDTAAVSTLVGGRYQSSFYDPRSITTDGTSLYIADVHRVRKFDMTTGVLTTLAGIDSFGYDENYVDGTGTAARFKGLSSITTDGTYLYVTDARNLGIQMTSDYYSDTSNSRVRKIEIATGVVTTLAGSGLLGSDDGVGTAAWFNFPQGIATDGFALFVADTYNNTIRKIE